MPARPYFFRLLLVRNVLSSRARWTSREICLHFSRRSAASEVSETSAQRRMQNHRSDTDRGLAGAP